jgi:hypothetical protein
MDFRLRRETRLRWEIRLDINSVNDWFSVSSFPSNFPVWTTGRLDGKLVLDRKLVLNLYQTNKSRRVSARNVKKRLGWRVSYFFGFIRRPSDGFHFILIPDGNPSHEFPVLDGNPSSNMNSANNKTIWQNCSPMAEILTMSMIDKFRIWQSHFCALDSQIIIPSELCVSLQVCYILMFAIK